MNDNNTTTTHHSKVQQFEVYVSNDTFKFNAAHFVAYQNYRERIHGHNYRVHVKCIGEYNTNNNTVNTSSMMMNGNNKRVIHDTTTNDEDDTSAPRILGADGYLIDFGCIKKVTRSICKQMNEHFLCPIYSNVLDISTYIDESNNIEYVQIICKMDHTKFIFPKNDCYMIPIVHATSEEIAIYIYCQILQQLTPSYLQERNIITLEVTVEEAPGQHATFRHFIPSSSNIFVPPTATTAIQPPKEQSSSSSQQPLQHESKMILDVRQFIMTGDVVPMPCLQQQE